MLKYFQLQIVYKAGNSKPPEPTTVCLNRKPPLQRRRTIEEIENYCYSVQIFDIYCSNLGCLKVLQEIGIRAKFLQIS